MKMIACEPDPDVVRWGLHTLIDVCAIPNSGSFRSVTQYAADTSQVGYVTEGYHEAVPTNHVADDAIIACAFQEEELSQIATAEAAGFQGPGHELVLAQDWLDPPGWHYDSGHEKEDNGYCKNNKETDDHGNNRAYDSAMKQSNELLIPISSPGAGETHSMEDLVYSLDMADEFALEGEVGKRLTQMVPIAHVPKINGLIPSEEEEISDHQRLLDRLKVYDLVENKVQGDGNCQFRALSDQLYRSPDYHKHVREQVVDQLKSHPQMYESYVPMAFSDYLKKMSKSGEWGDHVTLQAAADTYGVKLFVITSFKDTCYIEILPHIPKSQRVIFLSFWAEVHYNSIYPEGELPQLETRKKKKWGIFGC
uniref:ubiquitinyl hydrolase 1 n=1 Tax=Rhizophora mucronata TaxID=61149 RepID=A0A2P2M1S2_RHIMU